MHVVLITQPFFLNEDQNRVAKLRTVAQRQTSTHTDSEAVWEVRFCDINHHDSVAAFASC